MDDLEENENQKINDRLDIKQLLEQTKGRSIVDREKVRKVTQMKNLIYIGNMPIDEETERLMDFEFSLRKSVEERIRLGFWGNKRPLLDEESRVFDTMSEYRKWCQKNLPKWLGYGRAK